MKLKNLMEEMVEQSLNDVWEKEKMCKCNQCRLDILALTLNKLPPSYLITERGATFSRVDFLDLQKQIDVLTALSEAVRTVKTNPRH